MRENGNRAFNPSNDTSSLQRFLDDDEVRRLLTLAPGMDSFVTVAELNMTVVGWSVVHSKLRTDLGWLIDDDAIQFVSGTSAYLEFLRVDSPYKGKEIARDILVAVKAKLRRIEKSTMWLQVAAKNSHARSFYERVGWQLQKSLTGAPRRPLSLCSVLLCFLTLHAAHAIR